MSTRQKKKVLSGITTEAAEQAFAEYSKAVSSIKKIEAEIELKCTKIREAYSEQLDTHRETKNEGFEVLQAYANENKKQFEKKKSVELAHGIIGFRTGTHKLEKLKGFTWDAVKELVKKHLPDYIRTKEEINKEGLIAERGNKEVNKQFSKCGIEVGQDETFYVEPKEESVPA